MARRRISTGASTTPMEQYESGFTYLVNVNVACMLRVVTKGGPRVNRMGVNLDNRVIGSRIFIFGGAFYLLYPLLGGSPGYLLFAAKYLNNTGPRLRLSRVKTAAGF